MHRRMLRLQRHIVLSHFFDILPGFILNRAEQIYSNKCVPRVRKLRKKAEEYLVDFLRILLWEHENLCDVDLATV